MVRRRAPHTLVALAVALALPLGCRAILGVEERELVDGGAVTCDAYCTEIMADCTGDNIQYASQEVCVDLCNHLDLGALTDTAVDTIGCRYASLLAGKGTNDFDCQGAGPASTTCGKKCDLYCKAMETICVEQFATFKGDCQAACAAVPDCRDYVADGVRNDDSIQCRLFHLTSASKQSSPHCLHTIGTGGDCEPASGSLCTSADAGDGG